MNYLISEILMLCTFPTRPLPIPSPLFSGGHLKNIRAFFRDPVYRRHQIAPIFLMLLPAKRKARISFCTTPLSATAGCCRLFQLPGPSSGGKGKNPIWSQTRAWVGVRARRLPVRCVRHPPAAARAAGQSFLRRLLHKPVPPLTPEKVPKGGERGGWEGKLKLKHGGADRVDFPRPLPHGVMTCWVVFPPSSSALKTTSTPTCASLHPASVSAHTTKHGHPNGIPVACKRAHRWRGRKHHVLHFLG